MSIPMKIIEISECSGCKFHVNIDTSDSCLNPRHPKYDKNNYLAKINCAKNSIAPDCPLEDKK